MKNNRFKTFKLIWRFVFTALDIVLTIASDKRMKPRHSALKAHTLHEEGLISDSEYMQSLGRD